MFTRGIIITIIIFFSSSFALAEAPADSDRDGVPDYDEINVYFTDPYNRDTDNDGYSDFIELNSGYSPHNPEKLKLENSDYDQDGLSDRMELNFHTDMTSKDTDHDGNFDGQEVFANFNPLSATSTKLSKRIEINTGAQELSYFIGGVRMDKFKISSGSRAMPTPKGHFKIINKSPKAWSSYGLWMPYWQGLGDGGRWNGQFGLHELPVWPNGYREGENHLGVPVSHGCVRLGVGPAKFLYNWADIGTEVFIY